MAKLSIVVPCYNESGNIPLIFERFDEVLKSTSEVEVVLVNNGSTDSTAQIMAEQLKKRDARLIRVVDVETNTGYGNGILAGLKACDSPTLSWTHADMQTDPMDVIKAWQLYEQEKASHPNLIVKGKRKNRAWLEAFFTWGMQIFAWLVLGKKLDDINAQPKLFGRDFYRAHMSDAPSDFSLDLFLLYRAQSLNYKILEVPVIFAKRLHGEAKGGGSFKTRIKLIRRTISYILQLKNQLAEKAS